MINSSDFDNSKNYKSQIRRYFLPRKQSKISIIRLATHLKDLKKIIPHMKFLKKLGYKIAVNLMQIDKINSKNLSDALSDLKKTKSVDVFYFADSFGSLKPKHIEKICKTIKNNDFIRSKLPRSKTKLFLATSSLLVFYQVV